MASQPGSLSAFPVRENVVLDTERAVELHPLDSGPRHKLGELSATAICGNDITSSCLYVAALSAVYAGQYAPIALLLVAALLYLYRLIYAEVGDALPLNGGAYNCLLNTTSKFRASVAACMTLLSYMATAVISASEAMHYAKNLLPALPTFQATIGLLTFFALICILGITESATVASGIFGFHILTLTVFCLIGSYHLLSNPAVFLSNWNSPNEHDLLTALFFGFSAALLGISGFESSANFIEEQKDGVFPKTLRNMWAAVSLFNPLISLIALGVLPLAVIRRESEDLLAAAGGLMAGDLFRAWISADATLVLSGAVLTSFVGTTGLVKRMTLDRCLPQFLLKENRLRRTSHRIILGFLLLCVSILVVTRGEIKTLAGVYTISFLGVMSLFAIGNMLLKVNRRDLPRRFRARWPAVVFAFVATAAGIAGNVALNPTYFWVFLTYFIPAVLAISIMLWRATILRVMLFIVRSAVDTMNTYNRRISKAILRKIDEINNQGIVFFTKGNSRHSLNEALLYVRYNEPTKKLRVVHCYEKPEDIPPNLAHDLAFLDDLYPEIRLEFVTVQGKFGPRLVEQLSQEWKIPKNYMFIGSPSPRSTFRLQDLGGVRLII